MRSARRHGRRTSSSWARAGTARSPTSARAGASRRTFTTACLPAGLGQELGADEDLARLGALAGSDNPVLLHHVDEPRGLRVAETHAALQERDRSLPLADDEAHAVPVEVVALGAAAATLGGEHDLFVHGRALLPQEFADGLDLVVGDPGAVHAHLLVGARRHVN